MIRYIFKQKHPASHYVYIDMHFRVQKKGRQVLQLPAWRPGRYELGNFARNIKKLEIFGQDGKPLVARKSSRNAWEFDAAGGEEIKVTYSYFSAELNAGACYADNSQLYVNPVHCCLLLEGSENEEHQVLLELPAAYRVVSSMKIKGHQLVADNYEELLDSPFIASAGLQSDVYETRGVRFHLHFQGECHPDFERIKRDFAVFTEHLISFWGDFPPEEYHFLFQVLPQKFYHGVEHLRSTVFALGPGYQLNSGATYEDLLGVACHELFHVWNVKTIRPKEMLPYDYNRENYAATGYVYEGFTTYYGDKLLLSSGVFSIQQYWQTLQERLQKHFQNFGRYNLSVADSSRDTWVDGYLPGAPYRKTNIYDEGCLIALMLDVAILKHTQNKRSLKDVCRMLYERFGKNEIGYTEEDIVMLCSEAAGTPMSEFFERFVYAAADYETGLNEAFEYLGIEMQKTDTSLAESVFGIKMTESPLLTKISQVAPYSPAWKAGLFAGDEILAVNHMMVRGNLNAWLEHFSSAESVTLHVCSAETMRQTVLSKGTKSVQWFFNPKLCRNPKASPAQNENFACWVRS